MSSIIEEEHVDDEKGNYKLIYKSNVLNLSAVLPQDEVDWQRTTSFHEKLNGGADFKKDQKEMMKKLSTTQRLFNRNDKFMGKPGSKKQISKKQSINQAIDPEKDEMHQERKKELQ
jgi:hypothetical protein